MKGILLGKLICAVYLRFDFLRYIISSLVRPILNWEIFIKPLSYSFFSPFYSLYKIIVYESDNREFIGKEKYLLNIPS